MTQNSIDIFLALLRAGLWGSEVKTDDRSDIDWYEVYKLSKEQTVIGIILAGLEYSNPKPPQDLLLQWIGEVQLLEQQNKAMNLFIEKMLNEMRNADIYTLLVKGQGIAQCYEKPLWRSCGDVDLYMSDSNFSKAKVYFRPLVKSFDPDNQYAKHINMHYGDWVVELHENQYCSLSPRVDRVMDDIHYNLFYGGDVRSWMNGNTQVFLPSADNDILIVFTHFLRHYYKGGIGLRQICDWCRLIWTFKDNIDDQLLKKRLQKMGLTSIWTAFAAFAVEYIGMPYEYMPLYSSDNRWKKKAKKICNYIFEVGNFGHNIDTSYYNKSSRILKKIISLKRRCGCMIRHSKIFPLESIRFFPNMIVSGLYSFVRGE